MLEFWINHCTALIHITANCAYFNYTQMLLACTHTHDALSWKFKIITKLLGAPPFPNPCLWWPRQMSEKNRPTCGGPAQLLRNGLLPHVITFHIFFRCFFGGLLLPKCNLSFINSTGARENRTNPLDTFVSVCLHTHTKRIRCLVEHWNQKQNRLRTKQATTSRDEFVRMDSLNQASATRVVQDNYIKLINRGLLGGKENQKELPKKKYGKMNYENDSRCGSSFAI